jgi:hypothetical protein
MFPGTFEIMKSLLLSDVDAGCCFSSQTRMHDVSRQVSISVNRLSGELLVSITHTPCFDLYAFELYTLVLLHAVFPVLIATKKLKKSLFSFLVFSTDMSPTERKQCHKVTASSDEEDDAWMPGARVNVRPRAQKQSKRKVNVHDEKDSTVEMGKCAEATPVALTQADVCTLNHCSPEELAEMRKCDGKTPVELTKADLCNLEHYSPE